MPCQSPDRRVFHVLLDDVSKKLVYEHRDSPLLGAYKKSPRYARDDRAVLRCLNRALPCKSFC